MRLSVTQRFVSAIAASLFIAATGPAHAADIRVLGTKSTQLLIDVIRPLYEQRSGHHIVLTTDLPVATKRKIDAGEVFDVAILSPPLVKQLAAEGKIAPDSSADIVRVGVGLGVKKGTPVPDISTVEAFKSTLLKAKSIAYLKEGNTGLYLAKLVDKLGIADELKPKTILPMLDVVSDLVAKGEAEVGMTAISLLLAEPDVTTAGPIPQEIQFYITFTGGVSSQSKNAEASRELMKLLTSAEIVPLIRAKGMEPGR